MRNYLKELRQEKGLTIKEVAVKLDISESYYCLIEAGERLPKMTIAFARKIAAIFGVSIDFILENEKEEA